MFDDTGCPSFGELVKAGSKVCYRLAKFLVEMVDVRHVKPRYLTTAVTWSGPRK